MATCMLRLDDTNPETEEEAFVSSIVEDIEWLGYEPTQIRHASDYFDTLHDWAVQLIEKGLAYVDDQDGETISATRGSFGTPGTDSPFRNRSVEENLDLFARMRAGEFPDGSRVLRAKIDMAHENMQLRDPVMYRIRNITHHRTGEAWSIYPTYDGRTASPMPSRASPTRSAPSSSSHTAPSTTGSWNSWRLLLPHASTSSPA